MDRHPHAFKYVFWGELAERACFYGMRTVLALYYHEELTLREIAQVVNLHESRISQLKTQAILRLRARLAEQWPAAHAQVIA